MLWGNTSLFPYVPFSLQLGLPLVLLKKFIRKGGDTVRLTCCRENWRWIEQNLYWPAIQQSWGRSTQYSN